MGMLNKKTEIRLGLKIFENKAHTYTDKSHLPNSLPVQSWVAQRLRPRRRRSPCCRCVWNGPRGRTRWRAACVAYGEGTGHEDRGFLVHFLMTLCSNQVGALARAEIWNADGARTDECSLCKNPQRSRNLYSPHYVGQSSHTKWPTCTYWQYLPYPADCITQRTIYNIL